MAQWQIVKNGVPTEAPLFDDNQVATPGDDAFSMEAVKAHVATLGAAGDGFNYVGPSPADP